MRKEKQNRSYKMRTGQMKLFIHVPKKQTILNMELDELNVGDYTMYEGEFFKISKEKDVCEGCYFNELFEEDKICNNENVNCSDNNYIFIKE